MAFEVGTIGSLRNKDTGQLDKKIGIKTPFARSDNSSEGYFAATYTTMEATKENLISLLNTERGERVFQPQLGLNLKQFLFQPIDDSTKEMISEEINTTIKMWLPYITMAKLSIYFDDINLNRLNIEIDFYVNNDIRNLQSVSLLIQG